MIDCLQSVIPQLSDNQKIVIVDNDSADGSESEIRHWINSNDTQEKISLVLSSFNSGFSGGNNIGIKAYPASYYLLLNSDTLMKEKSLEILMSTAKENPDAGFISPKLEWPNGDPQISCFRYHSPLSEFISAASSGPVTSLLKAWKVAIPLTSTSTYPQ